MNRERYKRLYSFASSLLVVAIQTAAFAYVWYTYYNTRGVIGSPFWRRGNWVMIMLYALIIFLFSKLFSAFKVGYMRLLDVIISQILSVLFTNFITYLQLLLIGHWKFTRHSLPMVCLTLFNLVVVIIWTLIARKLYILLYPTKNTILIYDTHDPDRFLHELASRKDKYVVGDVISLAEGIPAIEEKILNFESVLLGDMPSHERNQLLKFCFDKNIRCYCSPKISDIMLMSAERMHFFDTPLLLFRNRGLTVEQQAVKRLMDIVLSLFFIVLFSPILLVIAFLVKVYDRGPVFYKQKRLTKDGEVFDILKFRSMSVNSEEEGARLAAKNDNRVTPVGRVIRQIHFDELPQFFNILKGDMSLVGPRPERPEIAAEYEKIIPEFHMRLKVKAGLTGYAQVYGKYNTTPYDKLKLDLTYIEKYSLLMDVQLIATTIKILFQKENTEGIEQWQVTAADRDDKLPEESAGSRDESDKLPEGERDE